MVVGPPGEPGLRIEQGLLERWAVAEALRKPALGQGAVLPQLVQHLVQVLLGAEMAQRRLDLFDGDAEEERPHLARLAAKDRRESAPAIGLVGGGIEHPETRRFAAQQREVDGVLGERASVLLRDRAEQVILEDGQFILRPVGQGAREAGLASCPAEPLGVDLAHVVKALEDPAQVA